MSREHKRKRNSIPRIAFVGLTIIIQVVWLIVMAVKLNATPLGYPRASTC